VIADAGGVGGHHVHVDAEPLARHAAGVANAAAVIDRKTDRHGVDHVTIARFAYQVTLLQHPLHFGIGNLPASNADFGLDEARGEETTRQIRHDLLDRFAGHLFGGVHGVDDGGAGRIQIDDRPVAHTTRDLMTDAEDARLVVRDAGNKTADLRRADIECRD
jgi:hypothetical protein